MTQTELYTKQLKNALNIISRSVAINSSIPILNNILFEIDNIIKLSATNPDFSISTELNITNSAQSSSYCIPYKLLYEVINNLDDNNITLTFQDNKLEIKTDRYKSSIFTLPSEQYPPIPNQDIEYGFEISSESFKQLLEKVVYAASRNESQLEMNGIFLKTVSQGHIYAVATDRFRLAENIFTISNENEIELENHEVIIPLKSVIEINRLLSLLDREEKITIGFNKTNLIINTDTFTFISKLIDGNFPNYNQIIPREFTTEINLPKQNLLHDLKLSGVLANKNDSVIIEFNVEKSLCKIISESFDAGKSELEIPAIVTGTSGSIMFNYKYLVDLLQNIDDDEVEIKINTNNSPILIKTPKYPNFLYLIMPLKQ